MKAKTRTPEAIAAALEDYRTALQIYRITKNADTASDTPANTTANLIRCALAYADTLEDEPRQAFVDGIQALTDLTPVELARLKAEHYHALEDETRYTLRDRVEQIHAELDKHRAADDYEGYIKTAAAARVDAPLAASVRPYEWQTFLADTRDTGEGLRTGYAELDKYVTLPAEAVTLVAARTAHGKTALLVNLCRNMVAEYENTAFAFVSYEQTSRQVLLRFLQRESGAVIDARQNALQIHRYLRGGNTGNLELERGKESLQKLTDAGRLIVLDKPYPIDDLRTVIARLKDKYGVAAVFVDYLQQIPVRKPLSTRQATVQLISDTLKNTAKALHVSIIAASQKNRAGVGKEGEHSLESLRESDDPAFDASVVLSLVNRTMADGGAYEPGNLLTLELKVVKNRDGAAGPLITLDYDPPRQLIIEPKRNLYGGIERQ